MNSGDTKYKHLEDDLHVEISTFGPPVEVSTNIWTTSRGYTNFEKEILFCLDKSLNKSVNQNDNLSPLKKVNILLILNRFNLALN